MIIYLLQKQTKISFNFISLDVSLTPYCPFDACQNMIWWYDVVCFFMFSAVGFFMLFFFLFWHFVSIISSLNYIIQAIFYFPTLPLMVNTFRATQDGRVEGHALITHLLLQELQNYNLLLNNNQQESVGSHQIKIPHIQGQRRGPSKDGRWGKFTFRIKPIPTRDAWRAQTNLVCTRTQRHHRD